MTDVDKALISPIEKLLASNPITAEPAGRAVVGMALGGALAFGLKPGVSFNSDGSTRPWILTDSKAPNATLLPYWAWVAVPGVLFGLFL